ncbi:MAG: xanthine dehydrogenase family protein subunit M [Pseudomonadales bacterium]
MIPGAFEYHRPQSVDEATALLEQYGDEAKLLAGGFSLIPMMKLRFAEPAHLIDMQKIAKLKGVSTTNGCIVIGAMTTQHELLASPLIAETCPILHEAAKLIADPQVRYCGTVGGNVANGDPGNDMPAIMMALDASYVLVSSSGERVVAADGFYQGTYFTQMEPEELLTEIRIPTPAVGHGYSYQKMKRKVGDYATAATAVILEMNGATCTKASVSLTNLSSTPLRVNANALVGSDVDASAITQVVNAAIEISDPASDLRGSAEYRRAMAGIMTQRAIEQALSRAQEG